MPPPATTDLSSGSVEYMSMPGQTSRDQCINIPSVRPLAVMATGRCTVTLEVAGNATPKSISNSGKTSLHSNETNRAEERGGDAQAEGRRPARQQKHASMPSRHGRGISDFLQHETKSPALASSHAQISANTTSCQNLALRLLFRIQHAGQLRSKGGATGCSGCPALLP